MHSSDVKFITFFSLLVSSVISGPRKGNIKKKEQIVKMSSKIDRTIRQERKDFMQYDVLFKRFRLVYSNIIKKERGDVNGISISFVFFVTLFSLQFTDL